MLGAVAAAKKHGDGVDASILLERLEAAAAEGLRVGKASVQARAWAARHRKREHPQSQEGEDMGKGKGKRQSSDDGLGARMNRLEKLMGQILKQLPAKNA